MEKFIPYEKLSKKEKRKMDVSRRQTWGDINPVTRKPANSKAYNRNKARNWKREYHETSSGNFLPYCCITNANKPRVPSFSDGTLFIGLTCRFKVLHRRG